TVGVEDDVARLDSSAGRRAARFDFGDLHGRIYVVEDKFSDCAKLSPSVGLDGRFGGNGSGIVGVWNAQFDLDGHVTASSRVADIHREGWSTLVYDVAENFDTGNGNAVGCDQYVSRLDASDLGGATGLDADNFHTGPLADCNGFGGDS